MFKDCDKIGAEPTIMCPLIAQPQCRVNFISLKGAVKRMNLIPILTILTENSKNSPRDVILIFPCSNKYRIRCFVVGYFSFFRAYAASLWKICRHRQPTSDMARRVAFRWH